MVSAKRPILRAVRLITIPGDDPDYPAWLTISAPVMRATTISQMETMQLPKMLVIPAREIFDLERLERLLMESTQPYWKRLLPRRGRASATQSI
jgi:hypothetical protein